MRVYYILTSSNLALLFSKSILKSRINIMLLCVCVCVCVYTLPPVGFFRLHDVCDMRERVGSTIFCCEYDLGASAKSLHLNF